MRHAQQIVLPTDDLRASLIAQIDTLRKTLGRTPAVIRRAINKRFGVSQGIDELTEMQLSEVLTSLEDLTDHREAITKVARMCAAYRVADAALDALLEVNFEGRDLSQLSIDELSDLRLRIEVEGSAAAGSGSEPAAVLM